MATLMKTTSSSVQLRGAFTSARPSVGVVRPSVQRSNSVVVKAAAKPPAGVTVPPQQPQVPLARFGFVNWAEKINSRACMIGFFALLAVEAVTNRGLLELMGLTIGNGLGFEL